MKNKIASYVVNHLWDHRIKIIVGPAKNEIARFAKEEIAETTLSRHPKTTITFLEKEDVEKVEKLRRASKRNGKTLFIMPDVYLTRGRDPFLDELTAIAELASASPNIDVVATSASFLPYDLTEIRGRITKIFFPGELFEDISQGFPKLSVIDYLFSSTIDDDILQSKRWGSRSEYEKSVSEILLQNVGRALTNQEVARLYKSRTGKSPSVNTIITAIGNLSNFGFFYLVPRYDLKKGTVLQSGKHVFPVTNRFFSDATKTESNIKARGESALVAKWFYDGYQVFKACHHEQEMKNGVRSFSIKDDGFLLVKGEERKIVVFALRANEETVFALSRVPSGLPKTIVSMDALSSKRTLENGISIVSMSAMLKEGEHDRV